jgi:serine/threonine-protein kinase TTK/MPS1
MLEAVHVIHEDKIVHSDLKPANFVLVRGELKLIDFGIAKAIANDTTNIQRDHHLGTVNYMSPEAIEETKRNDGKKVMKLGRPSDIWSLGCILYQVRFLLHSFSELIALHPGNSTLKSMILQMVYGRPPFHQLGMFEKIRAIPDPQWEIKYPEYTVPLVLGNPEIPDQRKENEATKVPVDVINSIKLCLVRDPKMRATIPQLLAQAWITGSAC